MPLNASNSKLSHSLLTNRQFLSLFTGNTALFFGFSATILVRSLLVWELTGDEMALAAINFVTASGIFVMSLVSGVIIDRVERRKLLALAQLVILGAELISFGLYVAGLLSFSVLIMLTVVLSLAYPFVLPTRTTMMVPAVGKVRVAKATSVMTSGVSLARMVSPAIAGFLAGSYGLTYAYLFMVLLYAVALLSVLTLKPNYPEPKVKKSFLVELKIGFSFILNKRPLAACMVFGLIPMLVVIPLQNLLVVFTESVWAAGKGGLGILMMAMGFGGLIGSLVASRAKAGAIAKPLVIVTSLLAVCLMIFSQSPSFTFAVVMIIAVYLCSVMTQTLVYTAVQLMTDDSVRGRVTTVSMMSYGFAPIGTIPLAYASKHIGAPWAMTYGALFILAGALWMWLKVPSFRDIDKQTMHKPEPIAPAADQADTVL